MPVVNQVDHIFCITLPSRKKSAQGGAAFDVIAKHSDSTTHDVGTFGSVAQADAAAVKWKERYLLASAKKLIIP